jgi:hypothetical protein
MSNLAARAATFPEPWKPEPGDVLEGELTELNYRDSEYGDQPYPILTILDASGTEWAVHAFHTMARLEVERKRPQVGDRVDRLPRSRRRAAWDAAAAPLPGDRRTRGRVPRHHPAENEEANARETTTRDDGGIPF